MLPICSVAQRIAYYDALYLKKLADINGGKFPIIDESRTVLKYYFGALHDEPLRLAIDSNIFLKPYFKRSGVSAGDKNLGSIPNLIGGSLGSVDITAIANGLATIMIKRAKQELTVAFFDRFVKYSEKNPEFNTLFPVTTKNLTQLITYKYPQMLPTLRDGFYEDLKQISLHIDDMIDLPKYRILLNDLPQIRMAIHTLRIANDLETGASNAADVIKQLASFRELDAVLPANSPLFNIKGAIKTAALFSESIRSDDNVWIGGDEFKKLLSNDTLFSIYLGLTRQLAKTQDISFVDKGGVITQLYKLIDSSSFFMNQQMLQELSSLGGKVNHSVADINLKKNNGHLSNEDYYNYINVSLDVIDYFFRITKPYRSDVLPDTYLQLARDGNSLYRDIYTTHYTQGANDVLNILSGIAALTGEAKSYKNAKDSINKFVEKVKPYALFMGNMVDAKGEEEVSAVLENVILPVGSSSIKKFTKNNLSVQSYLGAYMSSSNSGNAIKGTWSDKFGVTATIGISYTPGCLSWGNRGAVSIYGVILDISAIVDYKLKTDSVPTASGGNAPVIKKNYQVQLGQIFSPGVYLTYGFFAKLPLSIGFGGQYGPGLSKIKTDESVAVMTNPSWRWNLFLAVDLPFFTLLNTSKNK